MSCSLRGCGFGKVQKAKRSISVEARSKSKNRKSRRISTKKSRKRSGKRSGKRSRKSRKRVSNKTKNPSVGDEIVCKSHKKKAKVINILYDGGTIVLSCGCKDKRWNSLNKRKRGFGFKFLRNDQIIELVNHSSPQNLTCDRA